MLELLSDPVNRAKLTLKDLAVAHGIAFQNSQLALGGATARVETRDVTEPGHDDYLRTLADARAALQASAIDVSTGLDAGNPETKDTAPLALENGAPTVDLPAQTETVTPTQLPEK